MDTIKIRNKVRIKKAVQLTEDNIEEVAVWCDGFVISDPPMCLVIQTLEGGMNAYPRDKPWIIKGLKGEFYPCADSVFRESYEFLDS